MNIPATDSRGHSQLECFALALPELPTVALLVVALARLLGALMWGHQAVGVEHIPTEGPVVFASNHMSIADAHAQCSLEPPHPLCDR